MVADANRSRLVPPTVYLMFLRGQAATVTDRMPFNSSSPSSSIGEPNLSLYKTVVRLGEGKAFVEKETMVSCHRVESNPITWSSLADSMQPAPVRWGNVTVRRRVGQTSDGQYGW